MNSEAFYRGLVANFADDGQMPELEEWHNTDELTLCLCQAMELPGMRALVAADRVAARVFADTMYLFVAQCRQKAEFNARRTQHEREQLADAAAWSREQRQGQAAQLVQSLAEKYGHERINADFYLAELQRDGKAADESWQALLNDWQESIDCALGRKQNEYVAAQCELQLRFLQNNVRNATEYVRSHKVDVEVFLQVWNLMGGRWNTVDFERLRKTADLQRQYPVLQQILRKMGRVADTQGTQRIGYTSGRSESVEHATRSDITGVGMGRDLSSLLPSEWAQYADAEMEDLFFRKFVTGRLQTFSYQSNQANAARSLHTKAARPKGPVVVCVDQSGSMAGEPHRIALSLMMGLLETCLRESRNCYLVAFSTDARPVDAHADRAGVLDFFRTRADGGTDARPMLRTVFDLLRHNGQYAGADVLWVTDFRIPLPQESLYTLDMERLAQGGTKFYGLQIGVAENHWTRHFHKIYRIEDVKMLIR